MKPISSLITLSFLLFAFITILLSTNAVQIFDTNEKPLTPNGQYFIFPASDNPSSGGLTLNKIGDSECPITVLQQNDVTGLPLKFSVLNNSTNNIVTDTYLKIEFTKKPDCAESSKWLMFFDPDTQLNCVGIGGPKNYEGVKIIGGKFLILKRGSGNVYKLGFCLDTSRDCGNIGLADLDSEEGGLHLILTIVDAYSVVFVDAASIKSMVDEGNANNALPS